MLQQPLEEGGPVQLPASLAVRLTLLAVADQHVQQLSHFPLPVPELLHHSRELQAHARVSYYADASRER